MKGFRVWIFRSDLGDCTNGGVSARAQKLTVIHPDLPASSEASEDAPAVLLTQGNGRRRWILVPMEGQSEKVGPSGMFGGNYAGSSDSRWVDLVGDPGMVPIHDRSETWADHRMYSR